MGLQSTLSADQTATRFGVGPTYPAGYLSTYPPRCGKPSAALPSFTEAGRRMAAVLSTPYRQAGPHTQTGLLNPTTEVL